MQIIKFVVLVFVIVARLCRAEVVIRSLTPDQKTLDIVEDLVTIVTSCYGERIHGTGLGGDLPDTLLTRLSTQHLIPVALIDSTAKLKDGSELAPRDMTQKLHIFIVGVSSPQQLIDILRLTLLYSIWWDHTASYFILDRSPRCDSGMENLWYAWHIDILNAKVMCYGDNSERIMITFNPFTSLAPVPWEIINILKGKYGHPCTFFARMLEGNKKICVNLEFDKTKDCGGYPIEVKGIPYKDRLQGYEDYPIARKSVLSQKNIVDVIYRSLNVTPRYISLDSNKIEEFLLQPTIMLGPLPDRASYPFMRSGFILISHFRGNKSQLEKILGVIDTNSHIGLGISYLVTMIFFKFVVHQALVPAILNLVRITCGSGFENVPHSNPSRIFLTGILFLAVTMHGIFEGNLATLLTTVIPRKNIDSVQDVIKFNAKLCSPREGVKSFLDPEIVERMIVIEDPDTACLTNVQHDKSAVCLYPVGSIALDVAKKNHLHASPLFATSYVVFNYRTNFLYEKRFNKIISILVEADVLEPWDIKCNPLTLEDYQTDDDVKQNKEFKIIEIGELTFAFVILGIGLVLASITFVIELGIHYKYKRICRFGIGTR